MKNATIILSLILVMASCKSTRITTSSSTTAPGIDATVAAYLKEYSDLAISEMKRTGVPASITLAQGIIESDYGRSRLATEANNHFGIKCHSDWKGRKIYHDDDRRNECFRKYNRVEESYFDHSDFLKNGSRYSSLFELRVSDYKGWAKGLKKAGYATNPKYAVMLINLIEENGLYIYDNAKYTSGGSNERRSDPVKEIKVENLKEDSDDIDNFVVRADSRILSNNRIQYILIREGDTYQSLTNKFDLLSWEIIRYNELDDNAELVPGQMIYLQPKRNKAEAGNDYHTLKDGETMYRVSQQYGIKLKILYEKNRLEYGTEPPVGTELWLRKVMPEGLR